MSQHTTKVLYEHGNNDYYDFYNSFTGEGFSLLLNMAQGGVMPGQTSNTAYMSAISSQSEVTCLQARTTPSWTGSRSSWRYPASKFTGFRRCEGSVPSISSICYLLSTICCNTATTQSAPVSTFALDVDITIVSAGPLRSAPPPARTGWSGIAIFRQLNIFIVIVIKCTAPIMISKTQTGTRGCFQSSYLRFNWVGRSNVSHLYIYYLGTATDIYSIQCFVLTTTAPES